VERVAREAVAQLREAGVIFIEVDAGAYIQEADTVFWTLLNAGMRDDLRNYFQHHHMKLQSEAVIEAIASKATRRLFALASEADVPAELIIEARGAFRTRIAEIYEAMFSTYGISAIAFPTEPLVAPFIKAGGDEFEDEVEVNGKPVSKIEILIRNTRLTCALGAPGAQHARGPDHERSAGRPRAGWAPGQRRSAAGIGPVR
jgi:indoleacetamide hydrolase